MCLFEGSQFVLCSPMHHVCLGWGPNLFLCSPMHLVCSVCQRVPTSLFVLANAPHLLKGPNRFLCSLMHLVCVSVQRIPVRFLCLLMHQVFLCFYLEVLSWYLCSLMHHVLLCLLGGFQIFFHLLLVESISSTSRPLSLSFKSRLYKFKLTCIERT